MVLKFILSARVSKATFLRYISSKPKKSHVLTPGVYVSTCYDVFYNLAFETWVYENVEFKNNDEVCFLWRNDPCIVIGRHQNPWTECQVLDSATDGVKIARRASGGGTVFHDRGNLNLTFFTSRQRYNRKRNLTLICDTLRECYSLPLELNSRDDIICAQHYKVSGTAAKLGSDSAYHHCTLLIEANIDLMKKMLSSHTLGIESKATESVKSSVTTLKKFNPSLSLRDLMETFATQYQIKQSLSSDIIYADPTRNLLYPGIFAIYEEIKSWEWIFGKTPSFTVMREARYNSVHLNMKFMVEKGCIVNIEVKKQGSSDSTVWLELSQVLTNLFYQERFWPTNLKTLLCSSRPLHTDEIVDNLIAECFDKLFVGY